MKLVLIGAASIAVLGLAACAHGQGASVASAPASQPRATSTSAGSVLGPPAQGVAITAHRVENKDGILDAPGWGNLVRHDIVDGRVAAKKTIYDGGDAGFATISPDGKRLAFLRRDGAIMLMASDGGVPRQIANCVSIAADGTSAAPANKPRLKWVFGDGGKWVFFASEVNRADDTTTISRVNVDTGDIEQVVVLTMATEKFDVSLYATRTAGRLVCRPGPWFVGVYDLSAGDGDIRRGVHVPRGCGPSISPDGAYVTANTDTHNSVRIVNAETGGVEQTFACNEWDPQRSRISYFWQCFRWSVNSPDWIAVTQGPGRGSAPYTDAALYNFRRRQMIRLSENRDGEFDVACCYWDADAPVEVLLGEHVGEAPLTVEFPHELLAGLGKLAWDYGDGQTGVTDSATHTFTQPGSYHVTAAAKGKTLHGRVTVAPQRAPRILSALLVGNRTIVIQFDEKVRVDQADVGLGKGPKVDKLELAPSGRSMVVHLAEALTANDELTCKGIVDLAQRPNELANPRVTIESRSWPVDPTALALLWDGPHRNYVLGGKGGPAPLILSLRGARVESDGAVRLVAGEAHVKTPPLNTGDEKADQSGQNTFDVLFTPADLKQTGVICRLGRVFTLRQQANRIFCDLLLTDGTRNQNLTMFMPNLEAAGPVHFTLSFKPGHLAIYADGKQTWETSGFTVALPAWEESSLSMSPAGRKAAEPWRGRFERLAVYRRALDSAEIARNAQLVREERQSRPAPRRTVIQATLVEQTPAPTAEQVAPYADVLVAGEYEVKKVLAGNAAIKSGSRIRVMQWGLVGGVQMPPAAAQRGAECTLELEAWSDHPELEAERQVDSLDPDPDADVFVDVGW